MSPGLLAAFVGCQTSVPAPLTVPKAARAVPAVPAAESAPALEAEAPSIGSLHNDIRNGSLARLAQMPKGPVAVVFICVATGELNIAPDSQSLLMETWCVEQVPTPPFGIAMMQVEDTVAPRTPGKHLFRIPFKDAVVSVEELRNGGREVRLHYRDPQGSFHHVTLVPRPGERYRYSFAGLSTDELEPIGTNRVIELIR
jgi:hypothetical protein